MSEATHGLTTAQEGWLRRSLVRSLGDVFEAMAGERPEITSPDSAAGQEEVEWWEQPIDLADGASIWIGAPEAVQQELGSYVLRASGIEDASAEDSSGTYRELMQQMLGAVAAAIGAEAGTEVCCLDGRTAADAPPLDPISLVIRFGDGPSHELYCSWTRELLDAVPGFNESAFPASAPPEATNDRALAERPSSENGAQQKTMELLLDVELPVSVSFGRTHLPLRDVLKFASGSIIELNRTVVEPVEVIVNNCVVARGEVVVVEGNYGVRITEIISRQERLRTLN